MDFIMTSMRRTRIHVRSWHDIVLYVLLIGLYILTDFLLKKVAPNMSPKVRGIICVIVIVIVGVIGYIAITPLTQK
ncbi:MAG: hypothetical protein K2H01_02515 [Ruminococcus sp.]|nr:hypothetical protein [Ruminococcus sp.]